MVKILYLSWCFQSKMVTFKNVLSLQLCFMITKSGFYLFLELVVKKVWGNIDPQMWCISSDHKAIHSKTQIQNFAFGRKQVDKKIDSNFWQK